jgi:PAS domain S-box-containing protein
MHVPKEPAKTPSTGQNNPDQNESRFRLLFEKHADIIALMNAQGQILWVNASLSRLTGHLVEAWSGSSILALIHPDEQSLLRQLIAEVRQEPGATRCTECRVCCKNNDCRWFEITLTNLLQEPALNAIVAHCHDITARKQAEQAREQLLQERLALLETVDEFINIAGHELKTPVTSLKGFAQLLYRRSKRKGDEEALRFLGRMEGQLNRLTSLINDLLDLSRIQSGKLEYRIGPFDLALLAQEVTTTLQATTPTHTLLLENAAHIPVSADRERIRQVFTILLTNAIKYSPETSRIVVRVEVAENASEVLVTVQDAGVGIEQAYHQKIFDRFYQVSNNVILPSGLGIGLYLAREIVRFHHGRIWVESGKGAGSTFRFTLPLNDLN